MHTYAWRGATRTRDRYGDSSRAISMAGAKAAKKRAPGGFLGEALADEVLERSAGVLLSEVEFEVMPERQ